MITQIRHGAPFSRLNPAPPRTWILFDTALITEPQFHCGIGAEGTQFFQESLSFLFILALGPGLRHAQMEV